MVSPRNWWVMKNLGEAYRYPSSTKLQGCKRLDLLVAWRQGAALQILFLMEMQATPLVALFQDMCMCGLAIYACGGSALPKGLASRPANLC